AAGADHQVDGPRNHRGHRNLTQGPLAALLVITGVPSVRSGHPDHVQGPSRLQALAGQGLHTVPLGFRPVLRSHYYVQGVSHRLLASSYLSRSILLNASVQSPSAYSTWSVTGQPKLDSINLMVDRVGFRLPLRSMLTPGTVYPIRSDTHRWGGLCDSTVFLLESVRVCFTYCNTGINPSYTCRRQTLLRPGA